MVTFAVTVDKVTSVCWLLWLPEFSRNVPLCGHFLKLCFNPYPAKVENMVSS